LSLRYSYIFEIYTRKTDILNTRYDPFWEKQILDPYYVKPNITMLLYNSSWIFYLEF
jgi:hypothetical protein